MVDYIGVLSPKNIEVMEFPKRSLYSLENANWKKLK